MAITTYSFFAYNGSYTYDKWDVIRGGGVANDTRYFYSTVGSNVGNYPLSRFIYTALSTSRSSDEVMRVSFTQTGTAYFRQGSMVTIQGITPDGTANYTGVALGGGSGYVDILCAGLTAANSATAGQVIAPIHPNWTTGFYFIPSFNSSLSSQQQVIQSPMGDGYSQRMNTSINSNSAAWKLNYDNRTDKEARALMNFLQDKGGVTPFLISFPVGKLTNKNDIKYIAGPASVNLSSYGINSVSFEAQQVFDVE